MSEPLAWERVLQAVRDLHASQGLAPLSGDIASRLDIRPRSPERAALDDILFSLMRQQVLRIERDNGRFRWSPEP